MALDHLGACAGFHAFDSAAAGVDVADDVAHVFFRHDDFDLHHRLKQHGGPLCCSASLKAMEPAILNAISEESTSW